MKLSNIFKSASPLVTNVLTILVTLLLFTEQNQALIESFFSTGTIGSVKFQNIMAFIVFIAGVLKAFTAQGSTTPGQAINFKQILLKPLIKLLVILSQDNSSTPPSPPTNPPVIDPTPIAVPLENIISSTPAA